jgi:hypothetical protein
MQVNHELVAAKTAQHVRLSQAGLQTLGHQLQYAIPKRVTERVIDDLEPVQVQEKDGKTCVAGAGTLYCGVHPLGKQQPVGQTGQNIAVCQFFNAFLGCVLQGEVSHEANALHQPALIIAQGNP